MQANMTRNSKHQRDEPKYIVDYGDGDLGEEEQSEPGGVKAAKARVRELEAKLAARDEAERQKQSES